MSRLTVSIPGFLVAFFAAVAIPTRAPAQFLDRLTNPKITVALKHAPGLGLNVTRIAFGPSKGDGVDQVLDAITGDLVSSGLEVVDRQHLDALMDEHQLNLSGYVNPATAMKIGKFMGSTALVFVTTQRSATEQHQLYNNWRDSRGGMHVDHISETQVFLKVSIQTVDLTTGRTLEARVFDANPKAQNKVTDVIGWPVFPPEFDLQDAAIHEVVGDIHRLFVAWQEPRQVYFFNDGACSLKAAFELLKGGDVAGATTQSLANVDACKTDPKAKDKTMAHALYNVGMMAFLAGDNDKALDYLRQAQKVKDIGITTDAMAEVNKAIALAAEVRAVDARTAATFAATNQPDDPADASTAETATADAPQSTTLSAAKSAAPTTEKAVVAATRKVPASTHTAAANRESQPSGSANAAASRLRQLNDLYKQGLITKDELDQKRAAILKAM